MSYELIDEAEVTEPVTLTEAKAFMRIDDDYTSEDSEIEATITTARQRLEQYLNVGLANRDVMVVWNGSILELPLSPNLDVISVQDNEDTPLDIDKYTVQGYHNKSIRVNSVCGGDWDFFYQTNGIVNVGIPMPYENNTFYKAVYNTGYADNLPKALKLAILAEIDYLYKLKGLPVTDDISPNAIKMASGYSNNLIL